MVLRNSSIFSLLLSVSLRIVLDSSLLSSYTRVPATSLSSFSRCESGAVAIWLILPCNVLVVKFGAIDLYTNSIWVHLSLIQYAIHSLNLILI